MERSKIVCRLFASMASMSFLCVTALAAECSPSGLYFRSHGDQLKIESIEEPSGEPPNASFELITLGRIVVDAPTIGKAEGRILLTRDFCVGVYTEPGSCTLIFNFSSKIVKIRQINHCYFGAGATADGTFIKTNKAPRFVP